APGTSPVRRQSSTGRSGSVGALIVVSWVWRPLRFTVGQFSQVAFGSQGLSNWRGFAVGESGASFATRIRIVSGASRTMPYAARPRGGQAMNLSILRRASALVLLAC